MSRIVAFLNRWWVVLLVVGGWYLFTAAEVLSARVVPGPVAVVGAFLAEPHVYLVPTLRTVMTAAAGLVVGVSIGYAMAAATWLAPPLRGLLLPLAIIIRAVPFVALVPVLARLFGFGTTTTFVITTLICFFPTFVLVSSGLRDVPPNCDDVFHINGARRIERFRLLAVPAAMPNLATAVRISSGTSILAALVAEFIMGTPGLARVLIDALGRLQIDQVWAASLVATVLAVSVFLVATHYESRIQKRWR